MKENIKEKNFYILSILKNEPMGLYPLREKLLQSLLFDDLNDIRIIIESLLVAGLIEIENRTNNYKVSPSGLEAISNQP